MQPLFEPVNPPAEPPYGNRDPRGRGIAYCPSGTKFWFIWTGSVIRVQYGRDIPSVVVLPAPVAVPSAPPFGPGVTAFVRACEAWLDDDARVAEAVVRAIEGQADPTTVAVLKAYVQDRQAQPETRRQEEPR